MTTEVTSAADETDPRILIVTLNRPEQRNAMSVALVDGLLALLDEVEGRGDIRALVLTGAGRGFCAGSDLAGLAAMAMHERRAFEASSGRLARRIGAHPLPVIAAVSGFAIGGGLTLAAACDIVVTRPDAKWSLPEVPIGLFPAWGLEAVVHRTGRPAARRLAWGIDMLDGAEARNIGLADAVTDDPLAEALAIAGRLAALPALQSAAVKAYFAAPRGEEEGDRYANDLFIAASATAAAEAGFRKFGKRP